MVHNYKSDHQQIDPFHDTTHPLIEAVKHFLFALIVVVGVVVVVVVIKVNVTGDGGKRPTVELPTFLLLTLKPRRTLDITYTQQQVTRYCA